MERALRTVSVEEGSDPRDSVLVAFGGAGGLHASRLAKRLGIARVLIPPLSGVFSALGLLLATPRADAVRTVMLDDGDERLPSLLELVGKDARDRFAAMFRRQPIQVTVGADMRYRGQSHELEIVADGDWPTIVKRFHVTHRDRFGFARTGEEVEVVNLRAVAAGTPPISWRDLPRLTGAAKPVETAGVWQRAPLPAGFEITGPAVVVEENSATLLEGDDRLHVLDDGTLEITVRS